MASPVAMVLLQLASSSQLSLYLPFRMILVGLGVHPNSVATVCSLFNLLMTSLCSKSSSLSVWRVHLSRGPTLSSKFFAMKEKDYPSHS
jgi:hypothetical protein